MILDGDVFCFWDAQTLVDTYIIIFDTCMATLLLCLVIRTYAKARRSLNSGVQKFYYLMIWWGVLFIGKNLFSIWVFFNEYWPNRQHVHEEWIGQWITHNSKIYQLVDALPGVIVQTLLLLIPLHILGNMLTYRLLRDQKVKRIHRAGKVYFWARFIILLPGLILFAGLSAQAVENLSISKVWLIVTDGLICLALLVFVRCANFRQYRPLNASDLYVLQSLKKELDILVFAAISRITLNIFNFAVVPNIYSFNQYKETCFYGKEIYDGDLIYTTSYIVLGDLLMHFLPIFLIRRMYRPPVQ